LAIAAGIVLVFFILWYRSFKNSKYIFTCTSLLLALLLEIISVAIGFFFYNSVEGEIDIILTSFTLLPIVAVSFCAFFGVWLSNDFHGYELDYLTGRNFSPVEIEAYNKLSAC